MDISNINPGAHADQAEFPVGGGQFVAIPTVAKAQAVTALARRLHRGVEVADGVDLTVPEPEAMAIATAVVDPSGLRNDLERKRFSLATTPSGDLLVTLRADLWTAAVSCDGANGRSRLDAKLAGDPVWPLAEEDSAEPVMRYRTKDIDLMRHAVRANAKRISSPELRASIAGHPLGVWHAIDVVAARAETVTEGEEIEASFVHSVEGSTRVSTSQSLVGVDRDLALVYAGDTLGLVRRVRAGLANWISRSPESDEARIAIKTATIPANIVIGVLDQQSQPSQRPFPKVIGEFVQSIHEEPRPWNPLAQGDVRGERLVRDLAAAGALTLDQAEAMTPREDGTTTGPVDVLAGRLLRALSHPGNYQVIRRAVLEDGENRMTSKRYRQTAGPLLLTVYRSVSGSKTALAALTSDFQPSILTDTGWDVREQLSVRDLLDEALPHAIANPGAPASAAARELVARSLGAVTKLGLVLAEQGSQYDPSGKDNWLRGSIAKVLTALATQAGGLKVLCEAAERAADSSALMPVLYLPDGSPVVDDGGARVHLDPEDGANRLIRALAFHDAKPSDDGEHDDDDVSLYDRFLALQRKARTLGNELETVIGDLLVMRGEDNTPMIDRYKLDRDILGGLPKQLADQRDYILLALAPEETPGDAPEPDEEYMDALETAMAVGADEN